MTAQPSSSTIARVLETILASTAAAQRERKSGLRQTTIREVDADLVPLLRENLRAASQHLAMGHQSESFRECLRPGCLDAANLIPHLDSVQEGASDGELDRIFDRVQAALDGGAYGEFEEATASEQESSSPSI
ncbi:MAG TPA: hypothetical protein VE078_04250 [Thermoanaerobaculia bacterium]|nr:hypothetical protein [Thermoanaerobaculia bacterium]